MVYQPIALIDRRYSRLPGDILVVKQYEIQPFITNLLYWLWIHLASLSGLQEYRETNH